MMAQNGETLIFARAQVILTHVRELRYMDDMQEKFCNGNAEEAFNVVREYLGLRSDAEIRVDELCDFCGMVSKGPDFKTMLPESQTDIAFILKGHHNSLSIPLDLTNLNIWELIEFYVALMREQARIKFSRFYFQILMKMQKAQNSNQEASRESMLREMDEYDQFLTRDYMSFQKYFQGISDEGKKDLWKVNRDPACITIEELNYLSEVIKDSLDALFPSYQWEIILAGIQQALTQNSRIQRKKRQHQLKEERKIQNDPSIRRILPEKKNVNSRNINKKCETIQSWMEIILFSLGGLVIIAMVLERLFK